ncbi:MAG: ROK family protein [Oscillospiraceae bacterium]|nr:ROK family protein [Oscillospiraceae bacterium]MCI9308811.1 ROK family protein [Oscillospiraceae bacterium]MCI9548437.1 ROK family protein [Oscillospiraceae bacterium]
MKEVCFGVDIGGTTVKLGLVSREGDLLDKREFPTFRDVGATFDDIAGHMRQVLDAFPDCVCVGAGVGVPGPVVGQCRVVHCANLGWMDVDIARELSGRADVPVRVANDANLAALGESWQGGGKGCRNLVLFTVGTGVGGGIICDGRIIAGASGGGGEVGHMPVPFHTDWQCGCGKQGCLEVTASATGIIRAARQYSPFKEMDKVNAKDVYDAAAAGDQNAQAVVKEAATALGYAAAAVSCVVNPEVILLGGGVSAAGSALLDPVEASFKANVLDACGNVRFALAQLGNNAGIYGGAALFFAE